MEFKLVVLKNRVEFEEQINELLSQGWKLNGSHKSTSVSFGSYSYVEFSQSLVKDVIQTKEVLPIKDEVVQLLETLKTDAEMALDGRWDCNTDEGKEGFSAQIELIERTLDKLK